MGKIKILIGLLFVLLFVSLPVCADAAWQVKIATAREYAVFTLTYTGSVTGFSLVSPSGVTYDQSTAGAAYQVSEGCIRIGVRYAEVGTWKLFISGSPDDGFQLAIANNESYGDFAGSAPAETQPSAPTPTPSPTPMPTPTPTPLPTQAPKPTAAPTPTPVSAGATTAETTVKETQSPKPTITPTPATSASQSSETTVTPGVTIAAALQSEPPETTKADKKDAEEKGKEQKTIPGLLQVIMTTDESGNIIEIPLYGYWIIGIFGIVLGFTFGYFVMGHKKKKKTLGYVESELSFDENGRIQ